MVRLALLACAAVAWPITAAAGKGVDGGFHEHAMKHIRETKALLEALGQAQAPHPPVGIAALFNHRTDIDDEKKKELEEKTKKLLALAGLAVGGKAITAIVPPVLEILDGQRKARGTWCGLNAASAVEYFSRAGILISSAVLECAGEQERRHLDTTSLVDNVASPCMAQVAAITSSLLWAATWLTFAISECSHQASFEAVCAAAIEALVAGLAEATAAGDVARQTCQLPPTPTSFMAPFPVRRLEGLEGNPAFTPEMATFDAKTEMSPEAMDLEMALCIQDSVQAATVLGQFGVAFDNSVFLCPLQTFSDITDNACVATVGLTINRMFEAAAMTMGAVTHCGRAIGARMGSACSASVTRIVGEFAGVPAVAGAMNVACPGTQASVPDKFGPLADPLLKLSALGRRLEDGANATAPAFFA